MTSVPPDVEFQSSLKLSGSIEWETAQQLPISADLVSMAKEQLRFLALVDATPALQNRQVLERAIQRYLNCWLPLVSSYEYGVPLLPPLDCAWVWHCHKLNPAQYGKDCQQLFGRLVDAATAEPHPTSEVEKCTISGWKDAYPDEPYYFVRAGDCVIEEQLFKPLKNQRELTYDLVAAAERQRSFFFQVCRPWMHDARFLEVALDRYRGFLHLIKRMLERRQANKGGPLPFVVPTYDIDLVWHSHQLCPTAYRDDTVRCMGKILDHDDSDSDRDAGAKLQTSFVDTCEQWQGTYGTVYEHAGSLYRGPEPVKCAPPLLDGENQLEVVMGYPVTLDQLKPFFQGNNELLKRETLQVNLVLLGAKNVYPAPKDGYKTHLYIRVTALRRCPSMSLTTNPVECSSDSPAEVEWNEGFSLQAELSTEGLRIQLLSYSTKKPRRSGDGGNRFSFANLRRKISGLRKKPKCLGEVSIYWQRDLLHSRPGLSLTKWVSVVPQVSQESSNFWSASTTAQGLIEAGDSPQLHFSVSITPPTPAPHIFRTLQAPVTDDMGLQICSKLPLDGQQQKGQWVAKSVVDHSGREQFIVRTRWSTGVRTKKSFPVRVPDYETEIKVHQGQFEGLKGEEVKNFRNENLVRAPSAIVGSAKQMDVDPSQNYRRWSLFDSNCFLTVTKPKSSTASPDCQIQGNLAYPMRLLSGRWLEYEVNAHGIQCAEHKEEEAKYLTLVRYTPDAPMGKASALINWHSSAFEVKPEESSVLVVLLSSSISMSLSEMHYTFPIWRKEKEHVSKDHLGAMLIQRNGLSARWNRKMSDKRNFRERDSTDLGLFYGNWWALSNVQIYSSSGVVCSGGGCGGMWSSSGWVRPGWLWGGCRGSGGGC